MRLRGFIVLFLLALLVALAVRLPAAVAVAWLGDPLPGGLRIGSVRGTVWNGEASDVRRGDVPLGDAAWHVAGIRLSPPGLAIRTSLSGPLGEIVANLGLGFSGYRVDAASGALAVPVVARLTGLDGLRPSGTLRFEIAGASFAGGRLASAEGTADWVGARIEDPVALSLGRAHLAFDPRDGGGLTGELSSTGGDITVQGRVSLDAAAHYTLDLAVTATPTAPGDVADIVAFIGPAEADGSRRFVFDGDL